MDPVIRHITAEELPAYLTSLSTAFLERPDIERAAAEIRTIWPLDRVIGAFEGDRVVGTFRSFGTELTVPGCARLPASGIAAVTVMPDRRRRGILRRMVALEHAESRARGEAVALLHAAAYPIYGRFGYGPAIQVATWTVHNQDARFHDDSDDGSVELVPIDATSRDAIIPVFEAWRRSHPGEIARLAYRWDYALGLRRGAWEDQPWKGFLAIHRAPSGAVDGYVRYRSETYEDAGQHWQRIVVDEIIGLDDRARQDLWRFVVTMDLVRSVRAENRPPWEPLPWLLVDGRAARATALEDGMWVRLLDVPRALEARTYERSARLVLEVIDAEAPGGRTRVALDASPDGARCHVTDESPDVTIDVSALGAAYLGGSRLRDAVHARGADEHRPGALAEADALLATLDEPWCSTFF
jgi:predicted acetyltransferase